MEVNNVYYIKNIQFKDKNVKSHIKIKDLFYCKKSAVDKIKECKLIGNINKQIVN